MYLYHGTDIQSAKDIVQKGVDIDKSTKGYFGKGFYTATNPELAQSNYADFAEDEGVVLKFKLDPNARILDLDKPEDFALWRDNKFERLMHRDDFDQIMRKNKIDGLRDEGSFGGVVIYNPKSIKLVEEIKFASDNIALQFLADYTKKRVKIAKEIEIYRGEYTGNKDGNYWSTDKEWAAQFTQTGRIEEVKVRRIKLEDVYIADDLPYAGDPDAIDEAISEAKTKKLKAVKLDEGKNEPPSIYVFNKSALK